MTHSPQIPGLKVNQVLEEFRRHTNIEAYIPGQKDGKLPNRDLVINVALDNFKHNVDSEHSPSRNNAENGWYTIENREVKFVKKINLTMEVLPEFLQMFTDSKELSSINSISNWYNAKGEFHQMVRKIESRRE